MLGSLADLQRRPLRPCLFLAAWFEAEPATVEALALELGLVFDDRLFYGLVFYNSGVDATGLRLGLPLGAGSLDAIAEAALFLAIVSFAWPTRGGCHCWKTGVSSK